MGLFCQAAVAAEPPQPEVAAVKAAYLARLAPFVYWPTSLFAQPNDPLVLCVQGDDPFGGRLDQLTAGEGVGSHPIIVRRLPRLDADSGCQIAFLGGSRGQAVKEALRVLHGAPVLTVTDGGGARGIIDFAILDGRVRFRVDDQAAADNGLTISSKLLSLALEVNPRHDGLRHDGPGRGGDAK